MAVIYCGGEIEYVIEQVVVMLRNPSICYFNYLNHFDKSISEQKMHLQSYSKLLHFKYVINPFSEIKINRLHEVIRVSCRVDVFLLRNTDRILLLCISSSM